MVADKLTAEALRKHAKADRSDAWEGQARQLLAWAADVLDAAEMVMLEQRHGKETCACCGRPVTTCRDLKDCDYSRKL